MKIQLESLRVINCGPLSDDCIHFNTDGDRPITVLAGANGSGKTTILKLIVALAETLTALTNIDTADNEASTLNHADYAQLNCLIEGKPLEIFYGFASFGDFHDNYIGTSISARSRPSGTSKGRKTRQSDGSIYKELRDDLYPII